ncbi:aldehyde dehydrogenase (NADP(+)) [Pseudonocardia nematodicida]|uniref:Aldehyde dehydrogenase (NADP(+)) n=1 Tax=Pseudonocardia nematodicida TaxID=1206997 RepID=A0ABV1KKQ0_9PSEU
MTTVESTTLTGEMLLGAARVTGRAGTLTARDPRTGADLAPTYGLGDRADVERAAALAAEAFGAFRETAPAERAAFLDTIAANIDGITEALVERVGAETGLPEPRIRGEIARTTGQLRLFATVVRDGRWAGVRFDTPLPDRSPLPRPDVRQRMVPVGPVAVFGASNFPLAFSVAGGDTASALAAGCPVVVKAHGAHPGTSELVGVAIARAVAAHDLPEGVFSMVYGAGREVGTALVADPRIAAVGFTGSRGGGTALMATAAARPAPIPVYAEMSSINPVLLLPGALRGGAERLGEAFAGSLTTGVGQLCTNPGLVIGVDGPDLDRFVDAAADAVTASAAAPMLTTGICDAYVTGSAALRAHPEVTEVAGGRADDAIASPGVAHLFSTSGAAFAADERLADEVFGASSLVVRLFGTGELAGLIAGLEGQLTATLHLDPSDDGDLALARELLPLLENRVGRIVVNGWPTGVEVSTAMVHGGPFPATSDGRTTSVGTRAIERFLRPVAYQDVPDALLPAVLADANPLDVPRTVDGE